MLAGSSSYIMAISGIIFGILADKFSRVKLIVFSCLIYGVGLFHNGFAPQGVGTITSANQFLETIGYGTGTILAGTLLFLFGGNYQITASITMSLGLIEGLMWFLAPIWIKKDINRISAILRQRVIELSQKNNKDFHEK